MSAIPAHQQVSSVSAADEKLTPDPACVIYTPHGVDPSTLQPITSSSLRPLALLHGLHDVRLDWRQQLNLGAHNGLAAQKELGARWWVGTHDEVKDGSGVVSWFLRRRVLSVDEALEKAGMAEFKTGWREMGNGDRLVLE